jgi:hypothetical protein
MPEHVCKWCGKKYRFFHVCDPNQVNPGLEQQFRDALDQGKMQVMIRDEIFDADSIPKHIEVVSQMGEKYGYVFKQETHSCDSFGNPEGFMMIFEKVKSEEPRIVSCQYCHTRYDADKISKCPTCGAPPE